jgi:hypothetical protein
VEATTKTVRIVHSWIPGFNGARMRLDGLLSLRGTVIDRLLRLERVKIEGEVSLRGATVGAILPIWPSPLRSW